VAAGEERRQDLLNDRLLADDGAPKLAAQPRGETFRLCDRDG